MSGAGVKQDREQVGNHDQCVKDAGDVFLCAETRWRPSESCGEIREKYDNLGDPF